MHRFRCSSQSFGLSDHAPAIWFALRRCAMVLCAMLSGVALARDTVPVLMPEAERQALPGMIGYISDRHALREVHVTHPGDRRDVRMARDDSALYNGPFLPDGRSLLVMRVTGEEGPTSMLAWPVDGDPPRRIGPDLGRVRSPAFTPDGRFVIFESNGDRRQRAYFSDIYRVRLDNGRLERLTNNREGNFEPAVSPLDGTVVHVSSRDQVAELYATQPDGRQPRRLTETPRDEWGAVFSPDGRQLAFVSDREGADRIWVARGLQDFAARRLTHRGYDEQVTEGQPVWSPAANRVAFVLGRPDRPSSVVIADADNGTEVSLHAHAPKGDMSDPSWSPDGRYLAVTISTRDDERIWIARADGSAWAPLLDTRRGRGDVVPGQSAPAPAHPAARREPARADMSDTPSAHAGPARGEWHPIWAAEPATDGGTPSSSGAPSSEMPSTASPPHAPAASQVPPS